jgi:putative endonuclease
MIALLDLLDKGDCGAGLNIGFKTNFVIARSAATKQSRAMQRDFQPAVYIMANKRNGAVYVGVTSDLPKRAWQHREGVADGFTTQYGCKLLVWYELHSTMEHAILREKQLKGGSRRKKLDLIESANPQWRDLFAEACA